MQKKFNEEGGEDEEDNDEGEDTQAGTPQRRPRKQEKSANGPIVENLILPSMSLCTKETVSVSVYLFSQIISTLMMKYII